MSDICMAARDFIAALKARPDGEVFLRDEGKSMILDVIEYDFRVFDLDRKVAKEASLIQRLEEEGVNEPTEIVFYTDDSLSSFECIMENCDSKRLTKEEVMGHLAQGRHAIFDTSFDRLCNLGLPFDKSDFFIVNEKDVR